MKRFVLGLIIVVLAGGGFFAYQKFLAPQPQTEAPVDPAAIVGGSAKVRVVSAEGEVVPSRHADLALQTGGHVAEILVQEGGVVTAGDPLLRLDAIDQEITLIQAQANLAQAEADLQTANVGLLAAQTALTAVQVGVKAASVRLALAQAEPLPQEIAALGSLVDGATANITQTLANRDLILEGVTDAEILAAEAQMKGAYLLMLQARYERDELNKADGVKDEDKVRAQMQLNAAIVNLDAAEVALDELLAGATAGERQAAEGAVSAAIARRDAAQAQLELLLAGAKPEQIAVAEAGVEQAVKGMIEAELGVTQAEATVAQAEAGLAQAQAGVEAAQAALDLRTLTAPFDGTIADMGVKVGETALAGVPVVNLADLSGWLVETTELSELDVASVGLDAVVEVGVDALPGQILVGSVREIASVSSLVRGDVTYVVTVGLDDGAEKVPLRWGMTAYVEVEANR